MEKQHIKFLTKATGYDEERRLVWGWVSATDIKDLQEDIIEVDEFKKMYDRALRKYNAGELTIDGNHRLKDVCDLHETSKTLVADTMRWEVCVYVKDDAVWEKGKVEGFYGFSIGGFWERIWDETRKAFILKNIELEEFSLLFGKFEDGSPIQPANQLATIIGVKSMNQHPIINQLWGDIQNVFKNALKSLNQEGATMDEKKIKELFEGMINPALEAFETKIKATLKKELTPEDLDAIKKLITDMITAAMGGEAMAEPAKAAKAATDAVTKLQETVKALTDTSEKQAKQIADLLEASAKSQHKAGNGGEGDDAKKESAITKYAKTVKIKE